MNFTILHLSVLQDTSKSPILAFNNHGKSIIKNFCGKQIFSNCIFSSGRSKIDVLNSVFSHTLSTAVKISNKNINYSTISSKLDLFDDSSVSFCTFMYCRGSRNGGAIQASPNKVNLIVNSCNFLHCHAMVNGGGIHCVSSSFRVDKSCFINCTANSFGQAMKAEGSTDDSFEVNNTVMFRCSTKEQMRNAAAISIESVKSKIMYINFTRCKSIKNGAAVTSLIGDFSFERGTMINCTSNCGLEFMYQTKTTQLSYINFLKNTVRGTSALIVISNSIEISSCYIEGNCIPFINKIPGPAGEIQLFDCLYDDLGIKEKKIYQENDCSVIRPNDVTFPASPNGKNYCIYMGKDQKNIFFGVRLSIIVSVSVAIVVAHIAMIRPWVLTDSFSTLISGDKNTKRKRKLASDYRHLV